MAANPAIEPSQQRERRFHLPCPVRVPASCSVCEWRPKVSTVIPWEIEDEDARVAAGGPLEHVGVAERIHRIAIAGEPTLLNGSAGEFVVFGRAFGISRPVDEVH